MNARVLALLLPLCLVGACGGDDPAPPSGAAVEASPDGIPTPRLSDVDRGVVEAIESAREAVRAEPDSADAWGRLGNRYLLHDFLGEAEQCFARAEELDPERVVWSYRRGLCLIDDDPAGAAVHLARSLESLEDHAPAHENYANVLWRLGREDEAIEHLQRACALDPRAPEPETGLGQIYLARGELEKALPHLEEALKRDPRHAAAHVAIAQVFLGLGREEEARRHAEVSRTLPQTNQREDLFATPSLPPAGARAHTRYGKQLERRGQVELALEEYRQALRDNPDYYAARSSLATALNKVGRREEALELLREAQRANPELERIAQDLRRLEDPRGAPPPDDEDE